MHDDPEFLKHYVKQHPDNKMGWYLLGKHYESAGNAGKARYCYAKAGEIYEAFEEDAAPHMQLPPQVRELIRSRNTTSLPELLAAVEAATPTDKPSVKRHPVRATAIRTTVSILLLLAILLSPHTLAVQETVYGPGLTEAAPVPLDDVAVYWTTADGGKAALDDSLRAILAPDTRKSAYTVLVQLPVSEDGKWVLWEKQPKVILSIERTDASEQFQVQYHDQSTCSCTPSDAAKAVSVTEAWVSAQEQEAVLRSAMTNYTADHGSLPEQAEQLTRNYPENTLPGLTPFMEKRYAQLTGRQPEGEAGAESGGPTPTTTQVQQAQQVPPQPTTRANNGAPAGPLSQPLEIVVDRSTHRLALVSGNVIVRSYEVGLGGPRTKDGVYSISEKVMNPNGHSNGDFGSRGLTLSDTLYAIHGTNKPSSIGKDQSLGCVRMNNDDVEELYDMTPLGTKVTIGSGELPEGNVKKAGTPFQLPHLQTETNPGKRYKWL